MYCHLTKSIDDTFHTDMCITTSVCHLAHDRWVNIFVYYSAKCLISWCL